MGEGKMKLREGLIERTHEDRVNYFVKIAEARTDQKIKSMEKTSLETGIDGKPYRICNWSRLFHREMNKLTSDAGLRVI